MNEVIKRVAIVIIVIISIVVFGTAGFIYLEDLSFIDALYMTIITISTVGFGLVKPLTSAGKIFVILLILGGVSTVAYAVSTLLHLTLEEVFGEYFGRRRMLKQIERLKEHYIIAGYGRVGNQVAIEFAKAGRKFVVIENNPEKIEDLLNEGVLFIDGDATDDEILLKAGVKYAKGLIAALNTDADNVFITLSTKGLNDNITIVARANTPEAEAKLRAAGADKVISPYLIGARRMAAMLLQPVVSDYLDLVTHGEKLEYRLEELKIKENSPLNAVSIEDASIRQKTGALVLAIKREDKLNTNPKPDYRIMKGDSLVVLGTSDQLKSINEMI